MSEERMKTLKNMPTCPATTEDKPLLEMVGFVNSWDIRDLGDIHPSHRIRIFEYEDVVLKLKQFKEGELVFHFKDKLSDEPIKVKCLNCGKESYFAYIYKEREYCDSCWFKECFGRC